MADPNITAKISSNPRYISIPEHAPPPPPGRLHFFADIEKPITVSPGQAARVESQLSIRGSGGTAALVSLAIPQIAPDHTEAGDSGSGNNFFIAQEAGYQRIYADIVNYSNRILLIAPGTILGHVHCVQCLSIPILSAQSTAREEENSSILDAIAEASDLDDPHFEILFDASYHPVDGTDPVPVHIDDHGLIQLHANIAQPITLPAQIPTGLRLTLPADWGLLPFQFPERSGKLAYKVTPFLNHDQEVIAYIEPTYPSLKLAINPGQFICKVQAIPPVPIRLNFKDNMTDSQG